MDKAPAASGKWAPNRGRPRVSWDDLAELGGGLLALTGCPQGELARRVRAGDGKGARELLDYLRGVYEGYVAVEIWDHALPEERELADRLLELADRRRLPAVATNDVHYATPSGRIVHDVLTCLRHQVTLDEAGTRLRPNGEWHLKPPSVVWRRWQRRPDVVENTLAVAAECAFRLADLSPAMPGFQVPSGMTRQQFLESLVWKGAVERYSGVAGQRQNGDPIRVVPSEAPGEPPRFTSRGSCVGGAAADPSPRMGGGSAVPDRTRDMKRGHPPPPTVSRDNGRSKLTQHVRRQIRHEFEVIERLDLAGYFLTVWDIVRFARRRGILLQGRGSAANSCVCYCLGITAVDPIKFELLPRPFRRSRCRSGPRVLYRCGRPVGIRSGTARGGGCGRRVGGRWSHRLWARSVGSSRSGAGPRRARPRPAAAPSLDPRGRFRAHPGRALAGRAHRAGGDEGPHRHSVGQRRPRVRRPDQDRLAGSRYAR